jgi:cytochrome P450
VLATLCAELAYGSTLDHRQALADEALVIAERTGDDAAQLSFGDGIHYCIGAPLARIVTPIAITALLALPSLAMAGLIQWQTDPYLRAVTSMPLRMGAT